MISGMIVLGRTVYKSLSAMALIGSFAILACVLFASVMMVRARWHIRTARA